MMHIKTVDDVKGSVREGRWFREYRKKPIKITAIQMNEAFEVETMEGLMLGKAGDFLICGIKNELYPCDQEIFKETYEKV